MATAASAERGGVQRDTYERVKAVLAANPRKIVAPGPRARLEVIVVGAGTEQSERAHRPQHGDLGRLRQQRVDRRDAEVRRCRRTETT